MLGPVASCAGAYDPRTGPNPGGATSSRWKLAARSLSNRAGAGAKQNEIRRLSCLIQVSALERVSIPQPHSVLKSSSDSGPEACGDPLLFWISELAQGYWRSQQPNWAFRPSGHSISMSKRFEMRKQTLSEMELAGRCVSSGVM